MMRAHHDAFVRTTIDIPDQDHALFKALARQRGLTLGEILVSLAKERLDPDREGRSGVRLERDEQTGFLVIKGGQRLITHEEVKRFLDETE